MKGWAAVCLVPVFALVVVACNTIIPVPTPPPTAEPPTATPSPSPSPTATISPTPAPTATRTPSPAPSATKLTAAPSVYTEPSGLIVQGPRTANKVAFTLDMGSEGGSTLEVLDVLKSHNVKATFFVTGKWVEANPDLLKAIVSAGHELGNHSYSHPDFTQLSREAMIRELSKTEDAVKHVMNERTAPYFRPPFGAYDANVLRVARDAGYKVIYWTLDSTDWRDDSTVTSVTARVNKNTESGTILVMHGSLKKTALALAEFIEPLRARGLHPTSLSDLLDHG